jgi:hypothetical protein
MSTVKPNQGSQERRQRQWMALLCAALSLLAVLAPWMARTASVEWVVAMPARSSYEFLTTCRVSGAG